MRLISKIFPHDHKENHLKSLDGLRGLAVLLVLLSHSSNRGLFIHEYLNFYKTGLIGVYLFFVLSAYLLDRQIAIALISGKSSIMYWLNYSLRRFLRIYPLFILSVLLHYFVTKLGYQTDISTLKEVLLHLLLLDGQSVFWSIPVEFKYYFISPFIMLFCHKALKWNFYLILLGLIAATIGSILLQYVCNFYTISTFRYLPIFFIGTFIAIVELLKSDWSVFQFENKGVVTLIGGISFFIILFTFPNYFTRITAQQVNFQHWGFYLPYSILWGSILLLSKYGLVGVKSLLEFLPLRFLGVISYSVYLFHIPVLVVLTSDQINTSKSIQFYLFFIITISLSTLTYLFIEIPLSRIKLNLKSN